MIRWEWARRFGVAVVGFVVVMGLLHFQDPRSFGVKGPKEGKQYFYPSEAITANGKFIPAQTLMMDDYCLKCHQDAYDGWFHSAHHFSSFNNKAYLTSVRETRKVSTGARRLDPGRPLVRRLPRPGAVLLGRVRRPQLRRREQPDQPGRHHLHDLPRDHQRQQHPRQRRLHDRGARALPVRLQRQPGLAVDQQLRWSRPSPRCTRRRSSSRSSRTPSSARPATRSACPYGVNHYKDFVRGQNHYDTFLLSGVSGHGARSFYYPPVAKTNCIECHMELKPSTDFGAKDFDGKGGREIHDHLFIGANTGLAAILGDTETGRAARPVPRATRRSASTSSASATAA